MAAKVKNVLLFLTDQHRKDAIGAYDNDVIQTPNLDRLAAEGVRFERAYCQNPFCSPSRASILTGLYMRTHGVWQNEVNFETVGAPTLGDMLTCHGYRTGSVGKIHLNSHFGPHPPEGFEESNDYWEKHPEMRRWNGPYCGFERVEMVLGHVNYSTKAGHYKAYLEENFPEGVDLFARENALVDRDHHQTWRNAMPEEHHYNSWIARQTIEMIDEFAEEPFFIHYSFPDPHHPLSACEPYASMYDPADMPDPLPASLEELERMPPIYKDAHLGRRNPGTMMPAFEDKLAGEPLREMMAQMYGMVTHVDRCIGQVVRHLEAKGLLDETIIIFTSDHGELMGDHGLILKGPFYYQSLLNIPLIIRTPGQDGDVRRELVGHVDLVPTVLESVGLETPEYLSGHSLCGHLEGSPSHTRDAVLTEFRLRDGLNMKVLHTDQWKYVYYHGERWGELFNLQDDPGEQWNLFEDPACADVRARMHSRLLQELVETEPCWPLHERSRRTPGRS